MRILVLGGAGMLGHKVVQQLTRGAHDVWWTLRGTQDDPELARAPYLRGPNALAQLDAANLDGVTSLLREIRPDAVVNCLGLVKQSPEASSESVMMTLNARLPHVVARAIAPWGARLIHISSDCVFDGRRGHYTESDPPSATDAYGRSKALGEPRNDNALTLRTSLIGRQLKHHWALLDWFLSQRGRRVQGYRRVYWSGVTTLHFASVIAMLIESRPALTGVFHVSSGRISKLQLLEYFRDAYQRDVDIEPVDTVERDLSLVGRKFESATGYRPPSWREMMADVVADPTPYPDLTGARIARDEPSRAG